MARCVDGEVCGWRGGGLFFVAVDALAQFFSDGEEGDAFGWDLDGATRFGVTTCASVAVFDSEAAETTDLDTLTTDQRVAHAIEDGVDDGFDIFFGEIGTLFTNGEDEFAFCHGGLLFFLAGSRDRWWIRTKG